MPESSVGVAPALRAGDRRSLWLSTGIVLVSAAAWVAAVLITGGMSMPAMEASVSDGVVFCGLWALMMAAMMLPTVLPVFRLYGRMADSHPAGFVIGYLLIWSLAGVVAYVAYALLHGAAVSMAELKSFGRSVAIGLIVAAAVYQLTPLKTVCLRHCRSPLAFVMNHWHSGAGGALRMGLAHGSWCFGCCAGLMALLFAMGVMNVGWMVALMLVILAEKTLPGGLWIARGAATAMGMLAVGFALSPELYVMATGQSMM